MTTTYVEAWRKADPALEADARHIWSAPGVLPPGVTAEDRIKDLALVAYEDEKLAGLTTLKIRTYAQLHQKFAFIRGFVLPEFRMKEAGRELMFHTYRMIEAWAYDHQDEKIAGMIAVIQVPGIGLLPHGDRTNLVLVGYTNGNQQVRLGWFDHYRVPLNMTDVVPITQEASDGD